MATFWSLPPVSKVYNLSYYSTRHYVSNGVTYDVVTQNATGSRTANTYGNRSGWRHGHRLQATKSAGYPPIYSYSTTFTSRNLQKVSMSYTQKGTVVNTYNHSGDYLSSYVNSLHSSAGALAVQAKVNAACNAKLVNSVRGQYYSAAETLFELGKSRDMIAKATEAFVSALINVKRGKFKLAAQQLGLKSVPKGLSKIRKSKRSKREPVPVSLLGNPVDDLKKVQDRRLTDNWLEYRYGWMPLLLTIKGEVDRQFDQMRSKPAIHRVGSSSSSTYSGVNYFACAQPILPSSGVSIQGREEYNYTIGCRSAYYYRITNPTVANATSVGLTNPLLVAWELVPLSFVADWFINVSDVLGSLDAWTGKEFITGFISTFRTGVTEYDAVAGTQINFNISGITGRSIATGYAMDRSVVTTTPGVNLTLQCNLNPTRILDAVSLLRQALK